MLAKDNLKKRLQFNGGILAEGRMQEGKLKSLKKALLYSYQAATAVLQDGRMFRCLINPDKLKNDYDDKIISIPYEDICLGRIIEVIDEETGEVKKVEQPVQKVGKTSQGIEPIGLKCGDVFTWKETNTDWIVFLQRLEEDAYFRAEIRRCDYEIEINGKKYKAYMRGPNKDSILWHTKNNISWNDIDFNILLYVQKNEETLDFFHRFVKIEINGKPWEVQTVDAISTEGILEITIKEYYQNTIQEQVEEEKKEQESKEEVDTSSSYITGDRIVYPYDEKDYSIVNANSGFWVLDNEKKAIITSQTETDVHIMIITGRSGEVNLIYKRENEEDIILPIIIKSL
jgi:hypothetical protein